MMKCIPFNVTRGRFKHNDEVDEQCSCCEDCPENCKCFHLSNQRIGLYLQLCEICYNKLQQEKTQ